MLTRDEKIAKLGKVITDRATVLLGKDKITPDSPEYWGINSALKFTAANYGEQMAEDRKYYSTSIVSVLCGARRLTAACQRKH